MSSFKELKDTYEGLMKANKNLPNFSKLVGVFGYPEEDDLKSVVTLFSWAKKTPINVAQWIANHLTPGDMLSANDAKFVKSMRTDLVTSLKICASLSKKMSLASMASSASDTPEAELSRSIHEATEDLDSVVKVAKKMLELTLEGWSSDEKEEEVSYRW
ncbi:MAG: hypothetical protein GOU98_03380 [Candidatus Altiarchaeota archaeon]|nr:hypothetical protein [Candidatus Altiarchaeota archaeon]